MDKRQDVGRSRHPGPSPFAAGDCSTVEFVMSSRRTRALTPLAPIAPSFHGQKPIASYQRGRAAYDSDRELDLIFRKLRRGGLEFTKANPRSPINSARPKPYRLRAARSADEKLRPARNAKIAVDDLARIALKATPIPAHENGHDRPLKNPPRRVLVAETRRRRRSEGLWRRRREGRRTRRREVGLTIAERIGERANR